MTTPADEPLRYDANVHDGPEPLTPTDFGDFALTALETYRHLTGTAPMTDTIDVMPRLLTDLMYLADRNGVRFTDVTARAAENYLAQAKYIVREVDTNRPQYRTTLTPKTGRLTPDDRVQVATKALQAYDHRASPTPLTAKQIRARHGSQGLMASLLADLHYLLDDLNKNFDAVLKQARAAFAERCEADGIVYHVGDLVQLADAVVDDPFNTLDVEHVGRGWIATLDPPLRHHTMGPQYYTVRFPGCRNGPAFTAQDLTSAPGFPAFSVKGRTITTPAVADRELLAVHTRIDGGPATAADTALLAQRLATALLAWGGGNAGYLIDGIREQIRVDSHRRRGAAAVAAADTNEETCEPIFDLALYPHHATAHPTPTPPPVDAGTPGDAEASTAERRHRTQHASQRRHQNGGRSS